MTVSEFASKLGIETCLEFRSEILAPEERIRAFCLENKCGNYGNNYMCPPYVGSLEEIRIRLKKFQRGVLLQHAKSLDVRGNREGVRQTKVDFHNKILRIEEFLRGTGINRVWVTCPPKTGPKVMRLFEDAKIARKGALLHEKVPI
jgi:predicted metal-binding protein